MYYPKFEKLEASLDRKEFHSRETRHNNLDDETVAALHTNEVFGLASATMIRDIFDPEYLIGIGFGNLLSYSNCFYPERLKGLLSIDYNPKVVALGRVVRHLLRESETPEDFVELASEREALKARLQPLSTPTDLTAHSADVLDALPNAIATHYWRKGHTRRWLFTKYNPFPKNNWTDVMGAFLQNYQLFRRLAVEGNMSVVQASMNSEAFLRSVGNSLPPTSRFILYLSDMYPSNVNGSEVIFLDAFTKYSAVKPEGGFGLITDYNGFSYQMPVQVNGRKGHYSIIRRGRRAERSLIVQGVPAVIIHLKGDEVDSEVIHDKGYDPQEVQKYVGSLVEFVKRLEHSTGLKLDRY